MKQTMKYLSIAALVAMGALLSACNKEEELLIPEEVPSVENTVTLTTTLSIDATTKALSDGGVKTFAVGEQIAVVYENTSSAIVKTESLALTAKDIASGSKSATFTVTLTNPKANGSLKYIYPAAMAKSDGSVNYDALDSQDGTLTSLAANLDLAVYNGNLTSGAELPNTASLTNELAILALTLKNSTGSSDITSSITGMTLSDGTNTYSVTRAAAAGPIYVAIQPTDAADIEVTATTGIAFYAKSLTGKTYEANNGYPISWRMAEDLLATPLTVEALTDGTVEIHINGTLSTGMKYSKNGETKTLITNTENISVNAGDKVQLYGNGTNTTRYGNYPYVEIHGTASTKAYGNIMSLVDETGYKTATTLKDRVFFKLFHGNTGLTDASKLLLPAMTLPESCYRNLFEGCTALTAAPALPATSLASGCYEYMFSGCTSLAEAPELPAPTLAQYCYAYMFESCTSLTQAPVLPATTLQMGCYQKMFLNCTNLRSVTCLATDISASVCLVDWLMNVAATGHFSGDISTSWSIGNSGIPSGWTRLTPQNVDYENALIPMTMEALSDGTIEVRYPKSGMQYSKNGGAKMSLTSAAIDVVTGDKIQFYGNGTSITSYYNTKFDSGTAQVKVYGNIMSLLDETNFVTCTTLPNEDYVFAFLFENNTHLTDASGLVLPATSMRTYCYSCMFQRCTALTAAPVLPAKTLVDMCYLLMFDSCTSLSSVTCLATDISDSSSTFMWFNNVPATGTFTTPSTTSWSTGINGIPSGWTRVDY